MSTEEEILLGEANPTEIQELMERIRRNIKAYMNKEDIKIRDGTTRGTTPLFHKQATTMLPSRGDMAFHYDNLLQGKVEDPEMKKKAIHYAELMIQDNTWCHLQVKLDSGAIGELKVICCLPEHGQAFANYWIGKEIDSQSWDAYLNEFSNLMRGYKVATVLDKKAPQQGGKVTSVSTTFYHA